jgi:Mn2+/Fe2+ NRAMP family transporter
VALQPVTAVSAQIVRERSPAATTSDYVLEGNLDPAYISAVAALAGATIGGLTSFATSWVTQRTQLRHAHREAERAELKTLYQDFIADTSRLFVEA